MTKEQLIIAEVMADYLVDPELLGLVDPEPSGLSETEEQWEAYFEEVLSEPYC